MVRSPFMPPSNESPPDQAARRGRFIMVRHGESEGNRDRRFTITTATPLTDRWRDQAQQTARRIAQFLHAIRANVPYNPFFFKNL
jgi:hypothetical protein